MIATMFPFLVTFVCIGTYVLVNDAHQLDTQKVFVVIATVAYLSSTVTNWNLGVISLAQMWISLKRIAHFLGGAEISADNVTHAKSDLALAVHQGTFNWPGEDEDTLKDINLTVEKQKLIAVVGPVGCGKSSLVSAILGEMERRSGTVNTDGSIAYVAQQAWLQNATLQENILFGRPLNAKWYQDVIHACALVPDLQLLPGGDQREVGDKGVNLSGGQKQRIALARAVYANADIYLLDDPLSAVDAHVGKHIFDNVIGPHGLLGGKARLLVTHAVSFLPRIDRICVLNEGRVCEQGTYQELLRGQHFGDFLVRHISETRDEDQLDQLRDVLNEEDHGRRHFERAMSIRSTTSVSSLPRKALPLIDNNESLDERPPPTVTCEREATETGQVGGRVYWLYLRKIGRLLGCVSFAMVSLNEAFSVAGNLWMTRWSSDPEAADRRDFYLAIYAVLGVCRAAAMFLGTLLFNWAALNGARQLHDDLLRTVIRLPMSFFDTTPLGRIMNRCSSDVNIVDVYLPMHVRLGMMFFWNVVGVAVVISLSNSRFLYAVLGSAIFYYFVQRIYITTSRQLKRIEAVTLSPLYSHFGETLAGISTVRAYAKQREFSAQNAQKIDAHQKCTFAELVAVRWLFCRLDMVGSLIVLLAASFGVYERAKGADPALVGLSITYALNATVVLSYFVRMLADIETNIVAVERIEEYSRLPTERETSGSSSPLSEQWPLEGRVQFVDLMLRYRPGLDSILKGISFTIFPGQKIGIVGRTGAGKSSLTLALFRIIEAAGGRILIDGQNIADLDLQQLRSRLTIIPQEPVLFSGTVRLNLDPHAQHSDDELWTKLELAHLKAFVAAQPLGLEHVITEGGENLSIGQRQLVCLARALLRRTKVLILDEATAAVDLETDELIQSTIRAEFADCTVLTIAHRLHTIMDSDRVVVLDKGLIAELDSPQNLMNDPNSIFYGMAEESGLIRGGGFTYKTKL